MRSVKEEASTRESQRLHEGLARGAVPSHDTKGTTRALVATCSGVSRSLGAYALIHRWKRRSRVVSDDPTPDVTPTAEPAPTTDAKGAAYGDAAFAIIHSFLHALATTTWSTLELLSLPFPFSQNFLLDANDLPRRVAERRIKMWSDRDLNMSGLEELHRQALLVPCYGVDLGPIDPAKAIDVSTSETWRPIRSMHVSQLYAAATEGRPSDPAQETYEP